MGMFDYVDCEYPLPGLPHDTVVCDFQTKSFENHMESYTITKDGKLIHHAVRHESVPEEERPFWGKPQWKDGGLHQLCGSMRAVPIGDKFLEDFTGVVNFYTSNGDYESGSDIWYEWVASFVNGRLVDIRRKYEYWP